jgi:hypothetical protein
MVDIMHTDAVDMTLTNIAHITEAKRRALEFQVEGKQLPEAKRIAWMGEADIMVATSL